MTARDPIRVLFVDDEDAVLRAIRRVLSKAPLDVVTATGGAEALQVLDERPVDVIVSDIDMPGMSGLELLRKVRETKPEVVRMMLTGAATVERALRAINEGEVVRFFTKPFDVELFRASMAALVDRIERSRREREDSTRRARHAVLGRWLDRRFPGLTEIARGAGGEVLVDLGDLAVGVDATKLASLRRVLGEPDDA